MVMTDFCSDTLRFNSAYLRSLRTDTLLKQYRVSANRVLTLDLYRRCILCELIRREMSDYNVKFAK